ncbi:hypothetical protein RJT34_11679 [Clitoria ternatea]|uniref:Uncharacterized protein n=1 Tax=Clitoria ternatea TaxID=43366 RepID=A0AAN9PJW6_CLITE
MLGVCVTSVIEKSESRASLAHCPQEFKRKEMKRKSNRGTKVTSVALGIAGHHRGCDKPWSGSSTKLVDERWLKKEIRDFEDLRDRRIKKI